MKRAYLVSTAFGAVLLATNALPGDADDNHDLLQRGQYLTRAADCTACHTSVGGKPFAGGDAIRTPFGPIYPPNITPDKETGIGDWSGDEFYRALHEGIGRHGEYLYPAFPYLWFTRLTRGDVAAIKAYLDSVPPVNAKSRPPKLMFPFDIRLGIGGWDAAFFKPGEYKPDRNRSDEWNRGAYLVEGAGHCGDCHTPKGPAMEPLDSKAFTGGEVDHWYAPNMTSDVNQGIGAWTTDDLIAYLETGLARGKPPVAGPMAQVVRDSLSYLTEADLRAIAVFLKSKPAMAAYAENHSEAFDKPHAPGADIYLSQCAYCHQVDGKGRAGSVPALDGNGVVLAKGPDDVIRVVLGGLLARGSYAPMPAVGVGMSDDDIAAVADYVRNAWSNGAPINVSQNGLVGKIRAETHTMLSGQVGPNTDPCRIGVNDPTVEPIVDPQREIDRQLEAIKDDAVPPAIEQIVARARELSPTASQADIINALTLAYCRVETHGAAGPMSAEQRGALNRFSQRVYTRLVSNGQD